MRSIANGAGAHFRYTREVVFEGEEPFPCPESALARSRNGRSDPENSQEASPVLTAEQKAHSMRMLLQLFPQYTL